MFYSPDWAMQVEIQDSVLKAIATTNSISYVHVMSSQNKTKGETPAPASTPCSLLPSQEQPQPEQVFSGEQELGERPEDALELEVTSVLACRMFTSSRMLLTRSRTHRYTVCKYTRTIPMRMSAKIYVLIN